MTVDSALIAPVTALYAAVLAAVLVGLSGWVIKLRRAASQDLFQGEHINLGRAMRVHGNFCEYVPLALVAVLVAELNGAPGWVLHVLGAGLVASRLVHAQGLYMTPGASRGRVTGMVGTFAVLIGAIALNLWLIAV